jgi:YegS/Rv2252/BmrU family lipid kinase
MPRRALLLINRRARQGQQQQEVAATQLRELGFELTDVPNVGPRDWSSAVRRHRDKVDLVVVGGGDGSLNAAVDGIVEAGLPLGILPLGTANDLARTLALPTDLNEACKVIADGHTRTIDLGQVNGKHFFNAASLGLSVQISRDLTHEAKSRWGVFAYAFSAIGALWQARPFHAVIRANGETHRVKTVQIVVGNGVYFGGGTKVISDAAIDDECLSLWSVEVKRWWQVIPLLPSLRRGEVQGQPNVRELRAQEIEIRTHRHKAVNTDGELTCRTPAVFRVMPKAVKVFVAKTYVAPGFTGLLPPS